MCVNSSFCSEWLAEFERFDRIHIIGIGGAGMCALAEYFLDCGKVVTGSDIGRGDAVVRLEKKGVNIFPYHDAHNVVGADAVVYSSAIQSDNEELSFARGVLPCFERGEMVGIISGGYGTSIGVAGSHGKTTTAALIGAILNEANISPSMLIGGLYRPFLANGKKGNGDILVSEACEYKSNFLKMKRDISVLLNIDNDHLECFGDFEGLVGAFSQFVAKSGVCYCYSGDTWAKKASKDAPVVITFGFDKKDDYRADNIEMSHGFADFDIYKRDDKLVSVTSKIPGRHNIINILAAVAVCDGLGVNSETAKNAIEKFTGVSRRFETVKQNGGITVADDYAHHPSEIEALEKTARKMGYKRIIGVFEPFTYSRTELLFDQFCEVLSRFDKIVMCEIMAGRETKNTYGVTTSEVFCKKLSDCTFCPDYATAARTAVSFADEGDIILTFGCGDVYKCARMIGNLI